MDQPILVRMPDGTTRERGGRAATQPADAIITRRSETCGSGCRTDVQGGEDFEGAFRHRGAQRWLVVAGQGECVGTEWVEPDGE
jgi:hypothetical protein